ncbi:MAG: hypothetical protein AAF514_13620, partial [Verrucomicrobiota bacterium]
MNTKELLIAILIGVALAMIAIAYFRPATKVHGRSGVLSCLNNGKRIASALSLYAEDHDGAYPLGNTSSNEALVQLFPDYIDREKLFYLPSSIFCLRNPPDEEINQNERGKHSALEAGECHFAYVSGYNSSDKITYPILADGFTAAGNTYDEKHVWWKRDKARAVVVYLDGSGAPEILRKSG